MNRDNRIQFLFSLKKITQIQKPNSSHNSNFELLIAVILSAQATDTSVNKATEKLYSVANTPQSILSLEEKLKAHIKTIGLFNTKAQNILKHAKFCLMSIR